MSVQAAPQAPAPAAPAKAPAPQAPARNVPQAIDSERALLGGLLLDSSYAAECLEIVAPADFYTQGHQAIFEAILRCVMASKPAELVIVVDELRTAGQLDAAGGYLYVASLEQFALASSASPAHAEIIRAKSQLRKLISAAEKTITLAESESVPPAEAVDRAHALFFAACESKATSQTRPASIVFEAAIQEVDEAITAYRSGRVVGIPTGLPNVDAILGPLQPKGLTLLAARPSIGKTAAGIAIMEYLQRTLRRRVVYYSLEMGDTSITKRAACLRSGVPLVSAIRGKLTEPEFAKFAESATELAATPGIYNDTRDLSASDLHLNIRMLKVLYPDLELVIVDGLWLMRHTHRNNYNESSAIGDTTRQLTVIAGKYNVHILLLHQLSRAPEQRANARERATGSGGRPTMSDLRGSGCCEQDAETIILLHRERPDKDKVRENPSVELEWIIEKNRNGPIGSAKTWYNLQTQRIMGGIGTDNQA